MEGLNCLQENLRARNLLTNRLHTCLCEELLKPEIFFVTEVHLLHRFLIQIFFLLKPRQKEQPILWKDLFNMKRIKLPMLNKIDHCETWVKPHREEGVRFTALCNKTACNGWHGSLCCSKGEAAKPGAKAHDFILKYCSLWNFSSRRCPASEFSFDLWLLYILHTFVHFQSYILCFQHLTVCFCCFERSFSNEKFSNYTKRRFYSTGCVSDLKWIKGMRM